MCHDWKCDVLACLYVCVYVYIFVYEIARPRNLMSYIWMRFSRESHPNPTPPRSFAPGAGSEDSRVIEIALWGPSPTPSSEDSRLDFLIILLQKTDRLGGLTVRFKGSGEPFLQYRLGGLTVGQETVFYILLIGHVPGSSDSACGSQRAYRNACCT